MKKTIAILLVLVIGMVGVFAVDDATADLTLKTTVNTIFETKLLDAALSTLDFDSFEGAVNTLTEWEVAVGETDAFGYLYIRTNHAAGYVLSITGEKLSYTGATTPIDYRILAGAASYDTSGVVAATTVTGSPITALDVDGFDVSVIVDEYSFNNAIPSSLYAANVTFTFTAS